MVIKQRAVRAYSIWRPIIRDRFDWIIREHNNPLRTKSFRLGDCEYPYFLHPYNHTWANERAVEVAVALRFAQSMHRSSMLEIGNVLSHYRTMRHTVLDKYERCLFRPVINRDLLHYQPVHKFSRIVSISTIEHVGWDEEPRDASAVMHAFPKVRSLLTPDGKALLTIPVGYNQYLDKRVQDLAGTATTLQCMKRVSQDNQWIEVDLQEALACKYGAPYTRANAILFIGMTA